MRSGSQPKCAWVAGVQAVFLPMRLVLAAVFFALLLLEGTATAKSSVPAGDGELVAVRVEKGPKIDGTLDDPLWKLAKPLADFRQKEPEEGTPATERTEVRVLYDAHHIYFGVFCYDTNPKGIVATQLRRDLDMSLDDNFSVIIDPSGSHRNGYVFEINPLGQQLDGLVVEEQAPQFPNELADPSWDGLWYSAAKIGEQGWTATIAIPFSTLNFKTGSSAWEINFRRFIRRKNEEDLWRAYRRQAGLWRVSEAGELHGLSGIGSGRLLIIKPYLLGGYSRLTGEPGQFQHTGGVDIKYGIRSNLIANLTVNTDFADADVDQQQFNLTPFRLFFPEKRRFFLENSDVFTFYTWNQDLMFFSRQIGIDAATGLEVPIDVGAKVAGSVGGFDLGVMDVKTRSEQSIAPANYTITRVKRPMFGDSFIGFMYVDKESDDPIDKYNRAGGVDAKFVLYKDLNIRGFYAKTWSPLTKGDDYTAGARATFHNHWTNLYAGMGTIRPNYNPEVGFVAIPDMNPSLIQWDFTPRPKLPGVRELQFGNFFEYFPNSHGVLQTQEVTESFRVLFKDGALTDNQIVDANYQLLTSPFNIYKNVFIPVGGYHFTRHQVSYTSAGDKRLTFFGQERWGQYYTGHLNELAFNAQYRPGAHLALATNNTLNSFRLPQGNFDILLSGLQVSYAFNRLVNLTTFLQANTADREAMSANIRLRYTYRPDSDLYVIYNQGSRFQSLNPQNQTPLREARFAVKVTYSWSR